MAAAGIQFSDNVAVIDPVGYLEMLELEMGCEAGFYGTGDAGSAMLEILTGGL